MNRTDDTLTKFLNVDLDIRVKQGLPELLSYLDEPMFVLNKTETDASLELRSGGDLLDDAVATVARVVQRLPAHPRAIWDQCEYRRFNFGFEGGSIPHEKIFSIASETIGLLADVKGEITVTIYGSANNDVK